MRRYKYLFLALCMLFILFAYPKVSTADTFNGYVYDQADGSPIKGAVVAVGNWSWPPIGTVYFDTTNSEGYYDITDLPSANDYTILIMATGYVSEDTLMQQPPKSVDFYLSKHTSGFLVKTFNHGFKVYQWNGTYCYREESAIDESEYFFPEMDIECDTVSALFDSIGVGSNATEVDSLIWQKCLTVWDWLRDNASFRPSDPDWQVASSFMMSQGWPSIKMIAKTYVIYGYIPWGSCMSKAQTYTTLLHSVGVPKNRIAIAEARTKLRYSQHMYTILFIGNRWLYFDPAYTPHSFPLYSHYTSVPVAGAGYYDFCHPHRLMTIPGSGLTVVPEITNRLENTEWVLITSPPMYTHTSESMIEINGFSYDGGISDVQVNSVTCPVVNNQFQVTVALSAGKNTIVAEVSNGGVIKVDSTIVYRDTNESTIVLSPEIIFPQQFTLEQNIPNPFNPSTIMRFTLPKYCFVTLKIYNLLGKEVETLISEYRQAGEYEVKWNARDFPSGIYLYHLEAGDYVETRKLILQK